MRALVDHVERRPASPSTSKGEADQPNARESCAQGPRIHCVLLLLRVPPIASVQSVSTTLFRCTGGNACAIYWRLGERREQAWIPTPMWSQREGSLHGALLSRLETSKR